MPCPYGDFVGELEPGQCQSLGTYVPSQPAVSVQEHHEMRAHKDMVSEVEESSCSYSSYTTLPSYSDPSFTYGLQCNDIVSFLLEAI